MGHPAAIFLNPPDDNLRCCICLDIFNDPVSLGKCGHTFCRGCLDESLFSVGPKCPECRADVDFEDDEDEERCGGGNVIHSARVIKSVVLNATVRCGNCLNEHGEMASKCCSWTGPLSQWPLHSSRDCQVTRITCPIDGCGHTCPRSEMKGHVGSPDCVKAAVVAQVETQMNSVLGSLKKQMKEEVERRVKKDRVRMAAEKRVMETRVMRETNAKLELMEVNHLLRRENKKLRKKVDAMGEEMEEKDHLLMENRAVHAAMELSLEAAAGARGRSKKKTARKKRRSNSTASTSSTSSADVEEMALARLSELTERAVMERAVAAGRTLPRGSKKRKKSRKHKKSRQDGRQQEVDEARMRSVSMASESDVGEPVSAVSSA